MPQALPYAEAFFRQAEALSKYDADLSIRQYALDLLNRGFFEIVSPVTGQTVASGTSVVLVDQSFFFGFPAEPDLLVGIGNLGQGFPIKAFAVGDTIQSTDDPLWGINAQRLAQARQIIRQTGWSAVPTTTPVLVSGDPNFAHLAWNQLPALAAAVASGRDFRIVSTFEPLGPLPSLFPEIAEDRITRVPGSWLERCNAQGRTFVPLGSSRLSLAIRQRVLDYARRSLSAEGQACAARMALFPTLLWVSVRTRGRTASNQVALLAAVCRRFMEAFPFGGIVIDGHSVPGDLTAPGLYDRNAMMDIIAADRQVAADVIAMVGDRPRFIEAIGLPISDTVALAQHASVYFCHHGTVQHKIGWFSPVPGVVHSNPETIAMAPARWVRSQSEIAALPAYLPQSLVAAEAPATPLSEIEASLRVGNYTVLDPDRCADLVVAACPAQEPPVAVDAAGSGDHIRDGYRVTFAALATLIAGGYSRKDAGR